MGDCAVLVNTWDGYSSAWGPMAHGLKKYWPDCPWPIYWMSNHKDPPMGISIKCGDDAMWSTMMLHALDQIDTPYFIFLHEDYWLVDHVDTVILRALVEEMEKGIDHIQLVPSWDVMKSAGMWNRHPLLDVVASSSNYRTSNQAGIWKTESYKRLLRELTNELGVHNPWTFEIYGSLLSKRDACLCIGPDIASHYWPIKYVYRHLPDWPTEPIVKKKWTEAAVLYLEREGIKDELGPIRS